MYAFFAINLHVFITIYVLYLALLFSFGVKSTFSSLDYIGVLSSISADLNGKTASVGAIELAVSLVTLLVTFMFSVYL